MIDPTRIKFPKINKPFLTGIFWLFVFLFLASIFSSARGIYDRFLRKPEVRKETIELGDDIYRGNELWIQRAIIIHNRGNDDAKNVKIKCLIPNGEITRLNVISEEDYTTDETKTCSYSLSRLAAGSKIILVIWSTVSAVDFINYPGPVMPVVSASFDGGIAISSDKPTALEEVQNLGDTLAKGLDVIRQQLNTKLPANKKLSYLVTTILPSWGIYFHNIAIPNSNEFKSILITLLMLITAAWLLLPRMWAGLFIGFLFSLLLWLFLDVQVITIWLMVPATLGVIALITTESLKEKVLLGLCASTIVYLFAQFSVNSAPLIISILFGIIIVLIINFVITVKKLRIPLIKIILTIDGVFIIDTIVFNAIIDSQCWSRGNFWLYEIVPCTQGTIHGAILLGCILFTSYLLFIEL